MSTKRIGIMSYYYDSFNYGGLLQAYALTKYLNQFDNVEAEQICYKVLGNYNCQSKNVFFKRLIGFVYHSPQRLYYLYGKKTAELALEQRKAKISGWRDCIPHSDRMFTIHTIENCAEDYDCFITGSDQVWNMRWSDSSYFLDFVSNKKCRISYGASIGSKYISTQLEQQLLKNVSTFNGISVREVSSEKEVSNICHRKVDVVVDPTLLLTREQWDEVCIERKIEQKYVLCYFLGNDIVVRKMAKKFAREKGFILVTIPHAPLDYMPCDRWFGDVPLYGVDPSDFLSLIKYAEYVFTDSFHATVFSNLYQKRFIVFERSGMSDMSNRIEDLCMLFNNQYRFYRTENELEFNRIQTVLEKEGGNNDFKFLKEKEKSEKFLMEHLNVFGN